MIRYYFSLNEILNLNLINTKIYIVRLVLLMRVNLS